MSEGESTPQANNQEVCLDKFNSLDVIEKNFMHNNFSQGTMGSFACKTGCF